MGRGPHAGVYGGSPLRGSGDELRGRRLVEHSLFDRLSKHRSLQNLATISGTVPTPTAVFLPPTFDAAVCALSPDLPLVQLLPGAFYPDHLDSSNAFDSAGVAELAAYRVALPQSPLPPLNSVPLLLMKKMRAQPALLDELREGRIVPLGYLLTALLTQGEGRASESEVRVGWGAMWSGDRGWDASVLSAISRGDGVDLQSLLDFDPVREGERLGGVGGFWKRKYGLTACQVVSFTPSVLAAYISTLPTPSTQTLSLGRVDHFLLPIPAALLQQAVHRGATVLPPSSFVPYSLAVFEDTNGDKARRLVRDKYCTGKWSQFAQLALLIPPGGTQGADDKLFSFVWPDEVLALTGKSRGVIRYENGVRVGEYRDLRANPRCVLESQFLAYRQHQLELMGDDTHIERMILLGKPADNPAIPHILSQVFDLPIDIPCASSSDPASLGCAMLSIYATSPATPSFHDTISALLYQRDKAHFLTPTPRTPTPSHSLSLTSPSEISRVGSIVRFAVLKEDGDTKPIPPETHMPKLNARVVEREADRWPHGLYDALLVEFARLQSVATYLPR
ncbi:hypothetical protein P7C73_g515, partial [Tremellales sp. Uapishka_1]